MATEDYNIYIWKMYWTLNAFLNIHKNLNVLQNNKNFAANNIRNKSLSGNSSTKSFSDCMSANSFFLFLLSKSQAVGNFFWFNKLWWHCWNSLMKNFVARYINQTYFFCCRYSRMSEVDVLVKLSILGYTCLIKVRDRVLSEEK